MLAAIGKSARDREARQLAKLRLRRNQCVRIVRRG
jgi:hypothetical protein